MAVLALAMILAGEAECAASAGVSLEGWPPPGEIAYIRALAWRSDAVVTGQVLEIRRDVSGEQPDVTVVGVSTVRKGTRVPGEIRIVHEPSAEDFPEIEVGRSVLLFLSSALRISTDGGPERALAAGPYHALDVWLLDQASAHRHDAGVRHWLADVDREIARVRSVQDSCGR